MQNVVHNTSGGLLMYRLSKGEPEVLLTRPGGPIWANHPDPGSWTTPKGLVDQSDPDIFSCAIREFEEEVGIVPSAKIYIYLGKVQTFSGKIIHAWAFRGSNPICRMKCKSFCSIEYPKNSRQKIIIPETDRWEYFSLSVAMQKINIRQIPLVERLAKILSGK